MNEVLIRVGTDQDHVAHRTPSLTEFFASFLRMGITAFVVLLLTVTIRFGLNVQWDWAHVALAGAAFAALVLKIDILWVVLGGTAISAFSF